MAKRTPDAPTSDRLGDLARDLGIPRETLFRLKRQIGALGGTPDDLLRMFLNSLELKAHPANRRYFSHPDAVLDHVSFSIDLALHQRRDAWINRGKRALDAAAKARTAKTSKALERGARLAEREAQILQEGKGKRTKKTSHGIIAQRDNLKTDRGIKQSIWRYRRKSHTDRTD